MEETVNVKGWRVAIEMEPLADKTWEWSYRSEDGSGARNGLGPYDSLGEAFTAARRYAFAHVQRRVE